ncbi:hypothetical protein LTS18_002021, partial [Coniosporium uncinatum]
REPQEKEAELVKEFNFNDPTPDPIQTNGVHTSESSSEETETVAPQTNGDVFTGAADEIKLGVNTRGRVKKILGKIEARAFDAGLTEEEYLERLEEERLEKEKPELERVAKLREARGGLNSKEWRRQQKLKEEVEYNAEHGLPPPMVLTGPDAGKTVTLVNDEIVLVKPTKGVELTKNWEFSEKEKQKYAARAAEKGMSVEDYLERRKRKKAAKHEEEGYEGNGEPEENAGFVVDTTGNASITAPGAPNPPPTRGPGKLLSNLPFFVDAAGDPDIVEKREEELAAPLVWTPDMLGDRKVKQLTKPERRARLEWLRARRSEKHAREGKKPVSKKERHKARMERKMDVQRKLTWQVLQDKGKSKVEVTKQDVEEVRRAAKRQMRELKRDKRDKVVHRKKKEQEKRISTGGRG